MYFYSKHLNKLFKVNFYVLAKEIMTAKFIEVTNLFIILDSKISVGKRSTISV